MSVYPHSAQVRLVLYKKVATISGNSMHLRDTVPKNTQGKTATDCESGVSFYLQFH